MAHSIELEVFLHSPAARFISAIGRHSKIRISNLRVMDLVFDGRADLGHGVYLFFDLNGTCLYAGKNSAQNFVERIPWHFAPGEDSWMNHFLKYFRKSNNIPDLRTAARASQACQLLLIRVATGDLIGRLEKFCRIFLSPSFNAYSANYQSRYSAVKLNLPLHDVLGQL